MHTFHIDLYLRPELTDLWLFIPPYPSPISWPIKFSQDEILACEAGIMYRIDEVLWLGNELITWPVAFLCYELANTLDEYAAGEQKQLGGFPFSEFRKPSIERTADGRIALSNYSTRGNESTDYSSWVAGFVGTYYRGFEVEWPLWRNAVNATLDGLAHVFGTSSPADILPEDAGFAQRLTDRYKGLSARARNAQHGTHILYTLRSIKNG